MGITEHSLEWLRSRPEFKARPLRMLELGNQHFFFNGQKSRPAKPYFEGIGIEHISLDINGRDGAIPIDLSEEAVWQDWAPVVKKPGDDTYAFRHFDIATDFGTSEHVDNLWQCLEHIHELTKPGALIFHRNPLPGHWPGHGLHYRGLDFYPPYAKLCGYTIVECFPSAACGNVVDGMEVCCLLRRGGEETTFPDRDAFSRLPVHRQ